MMAASMRHQPAWGKPRYRAGLQAAVALSHVGRALEYRLLTLLWLPTERTTLGFPSSLRCPVPSGGCGHPWAGLVPCVSYTASLHRCFGPLCPQAWCSLLPYSLLCPSTVTGESTQVASEAQSIFFGMTSQRGNPCSSSTFLSYRPCLASDRRRLLFFILSRLSQACRGWRETPAVPLARALKFLLKKRVSKQLIWPSADRHAGPWPGGFSGQPLGQTAALLMDNAEHHL